MQKDDTSQLRRHNSASSLCIVYRPIVYTYEGDLRSALLVSSYQYPDLLSVQRGDCSIYSLIVVRCECFALNLLLNAFVCSSAINMRRLRFHEPWCVFLKLFESVKNFAGEKRR